MLKRVICLMGPTASGKTAQALDLVKHFPLEIISVDSGMIYRGMDIGTAKPTLAELALAPHHLIDILDPSEAFSAAQFCKEAHQLIEAIHHRGKIPLLVGGTMMYFNALQKGLSVLPDANEEVRQQLFARALQSGWPALHDELMIVDPVCAKRIHPHDAQRIQRALEVFYLTQKPLSFLQQQQISNVNYEFVNLILFPEHRNWLHQRIADRFALMLDKGFIAELEQLLSQWPLSLASPALRCVGYRQGYTYLSGECDYDSFCEKSLAATRQLAKRQLTWLRHWPSAYSINCDDFEGANKKIMAIIQEILDNEPQNESN